MSLFLSREVGKLGKLGIWQITESSDELMKMKGFYSRPVMVNSFSNEDKKKEYLVSRILVRKLTGEKNIRIIYDKHNKPFLLRSGTFGKNSNNYRGLLKTKKSGADKSEKAKLPIGNQDLRTQPGEGIKSFAEVPYISISHSHHLLAVIIDTHETGIDIELIKPKIIRIKEKFMNNEELYSIEKRNEAEQLTVYWCAKESLYKWYGKRKLVFKENLFIESFEYLQEGMIKGWIKNSLMKKSFLLRYEKLNIDDAAYIMTYLVNED